MAIPECREDQELKAAGLAYFVVSMYDGPHQELKFTAMFKAAGCDDFILRDRWHSDADDFGLKLTNRAGTIDAGNQPEVDETRVCHYLAYQLTVDWNGDVTLCAQDWTKRTRFGNLSQQSVLEIWHSAAMHKRRMKLLSGKRTDSPCNECNVDGTLHGFNHVPHWGQNANRGTRSGQDRSDADGHRPLELSERQRDLPDAILYSDAGKLAVAQRDAATVMEDAQPACAGSA